MVWLCETKARSVIFIILLLLLLLLLLLNTLQAQGGRHENGGKVLWVKRDVLDGHTLTLQCSQRDANINTVVMKRDDDGDLVIKL